MHWRLLEVGEVHGNLRHAADQKSRAFDEAHAAVGEAHRLGDLFSDLDVRCVEKNVVGDQKFPRPPNGCTGSRMNASLSDIGTACRIRRNFRADALELAAANIFEALALGNSSGRFVEIYRRFATLPAFF